MQVIFFRYQCMQGQWEGEMTTSHLLRYKLWIHCSSLLFHHLSPVWSWRCCLTSLCFPFLWYKLRPIILEPCTVTAHTRWWSICKSNVDVRLLWTALSSSAPTASHSFSLPDFLPLEISYPSLCLPNCHVSIFLQPIVFSLVSYSRKFYGGFLQM